MPPGSFELFEAGSSKNGKKENKTNFPMYSYIIPRCSPVLLFLHYLVSITEGKRLRNGKASI